MHLAKKYLFFLKQGCPFWDDWSKWDECSVTCGGGINLRKRDCINGTQGDEGCDGSSVEMGVCKSEVTFLHNVIVFCLC